jgi:AAA family ATP:ADP antiporter
VANPLRNIFTVRRQELPLAMLMFVYFFLVIASFWILKPLKKSLFIEFYKARDGFDLLGTVLTGSQAEQLAKVLNMVVAIAAVAVFTWLARRFQRQWLTFIFSAFFMLCYVLFSFLVRDPGQGTVWSFYLFGDLFSTLMVATYFAFLNDSVTPDAAKRMYGLTGLGGVVGGAFGSTVVRTWIDSFSMSGWLWVCFGIAVIIVAVAAAAGQLVDRNPPPEPDRVPTPAKAPDPRRAPDPAPAPSRPGNPALEGARLVFRSPYLLAVVGIVGLYEIASTIMDFQFTATIEHYLDGDAIGRQFATAFTITNWVSLFVQLFFTSFIMTRFGLTAALLVLPVAMTLGSGGFLVMPVLWVGTLLNTADNGFSYSINQSAKESLYVPTTRDEKYKAKAFIDMFVQRFAKALAVVLNLGITVAFRDFAAVRWLSIATIVIILLWSFAARYAGRRFAAVTAGDGSPGGS